ncbi:MAG: hypothetical protein V3V08_24270 [Nannocystaceae bacterium]
MTALSLPLKALGIPVTPDDLRPTRRRLSERVPGATNGLRVSPTRKRQMLAGWLEDKDRATKLADRIDNEGSFGEVTRAFVLCASGPANVTRSCG